MVLKTYKMAAQKRLTRGVSLFIVFRKISSYFLRNLKSFPRYLAVSPRISSMRSS